MRGPRPPVLVLATEHIEILQQNLRTGKVEQRLARRSRILLLRAEGLGRTEVAQRVGCGRNTTWRIEQRYRTAGLDALYDRPRPGRPATVSPPAAGTVRRTGLPKAG